jgi:glycosyltransferase A (GT-A) superfamily protein (DUF2064 family)
MSLEEYEIGPERISVVEDVVVVVADCPQLAVKITAATNKAMRRILYSLGRTRMRPS